MLPHQAEQDGHALSEAYLEQHFGRANPPIPNPHQPLVTYLSQLNKTCDGAGQQVAGRDRVMAALGFLHFAGLARLVSPGARATAVEETQQEEKLLGTWTFAKAVLNRRRQ